jgi:hypothetical protein
VIAGASALGLSTLLPGLPAWAEANGGRGRPGTAAPRDDAATRTLSLAAAASLGEDYFTLSLTDFDSGTDSIVGYPQDNEFVTESMVVHAGVLSQLYHDWTHEQAWAMAAVTDSTGRSATGVIEAVAGTPLDADNQIQQLHVFYRTADGVTHLRQEHDSTWTDLGDVSWPSSGQLRQAQDPDGGLFVYTVDLDGSLYWHSVYCDALGVERSRGGTVSGAAASGPASQLWVARLSVAGTPTNDRANPTYQVLSFGVASAVLPTLYIRAAAVAATGTGQTSNAGPVSGLPSTTRYPGMQVVNAVEHAFAMSEWEFPMVILRDGQNQVWAVAAGQDAWTWQKLFAPPAGRAAAVRVVAGVRALATSEGPDAAARADKVLDLYCVADSVLNVVHQVPSGDPVADSQRPSFSPAVPLQPKVAQVAVSATRGTGGELILLDADGSLTSLSLVVQADGSDSGAQVWTSTVIHLPSTEVVEVPSYRVEVAVTDADGFPVSGAAVSVATSAPTLAVTAMGQTYPIGPASPVTAATNTFGRLTLALPADGMAAPSVLVSCQGAASVTVYPDAPVHSYLSGVAGLNGLPTFGADTLKAAQVRDTSGATRSLAPSLQSDPSLASSAATTMANASALGLAGVAAPTSGSLSVPQTGSRRRKHPRGRTNLACPPSRRHRPPRRRRRSDPGVELSLNSFLHDCLHAIKTGAAVVTRVALDAEHGVVSIVTDLEALGGQAISFTVQTLQDAAHVLHAVVNAIGAAVTDFLNWLKAEILSILADIIGLANRYGTWLGNGATFVGGLMAVGEQQAKDWLASQKTSVHQSLQRFADSHGSQPLISSSPQTAAARSVPQSRRGMFNGQWLSGQVGDDPATQPVVTGTHSTHAHWLEEKLTGFLAVAPVPLPSSDAIDGPLEEFAKNVAQAAEELVKGFSDLAKALGDAVTMRGFSIAEFVNAIDELVDGLFDVVGAVVELVLGLAAAVLAELTEILDARIDDLPIVGPLLAKAGVPNLSLGTLACLALAFPSIVAYRVATNGGTPALARPDQEVRAGLLGDADQDLNLLGYTAIVFWSLSDFYGLYSTSSFFTAVDTVTPFVLGGLTFPGADGAEPYTALPVSTGNLDELNFISWLTGVGPGVLGAVALYISRRYLDAGDEPMVQSIQNGLGWLSGLCGGIGLATSVDATAETPGASPWAYLVDVLTNLPTLLTPLGTPELASATAETGKLILSVSYAGEMLGGAYGFLLTRYP